MERAARRTGTEIGEERLSLLVAYAEELRKWNKAYNLVSRNMGVDGMADLFVDSIAPLCIKGLLGEGKEVVDIGSGAGLPGIPLYIAAGPFPLTLVEPQRKKITFLRHVRKNLGLEQVEICPRRVEEMAREDENLNAFEVGLARAVMDPLRLARIARSLICEKGRLVLFVGRGDSEKIRRSNTTLERCGLKLETMRSTQRITGKDNYLTVLAKKGP